MQAWDWLKNKIFGDKDRECPKKAMLDEDRPLSDLQEKKYQRNVQKFGKRFESS